MKMKITHDTNSVFQEFLFLTYKITVLFLTFNTTQKTVALLAIALLYLA
jgi:hypothetical protein